MWANGGQNKCRSTITLSFSLSHSYLIITKKKIEYKNIDKIHLYRSCVRSIFLMIGYISGWQDTLPAENFILDIDLWMQWKRKNSLDASYKVKQMLCAWKGRLVRSRVAPGRKMAFENILTAVILFCKRTLSFNKKKNKWYLFFYSQWRCVFSYLNPNEDNFNLTKA